MLRLDVRVPPQRIRSHIAGRRCFVYAVRECLCPCRYVCAKTGNLCRSTPLCRKKQENDTAGIWSDVVRAYLHAAKTCPFVRTFPTHSHNWKNDSSHYTSSHTSYMQIRITSYDCSCLNVLRPPQTSFQNFSSLNKKGGSKEPPFYFHRRKLQPLTAFARD